MVEDARVYHDVVLKLPALAADDHGIPAHTFMSGIRGPDHENAVDVFKGKETCTEKVQPPNYQAWRTERKNREPTRTSPSRIPAFLAEDMRANQIIMLDFSARVADEPSRRATHK